MRKKSNLTQPWMHWGLRQDSTVEYANIHQKQEWCPLKLWFVPLPQTFTLFCVWGNHLLKHTLFIYKYSFVILAKEINSVCCWNWLNLKLNMGPNLHFYPPIYIVTQDTKIIKKIPPSCFYSFEISEQVNDFFIKK